MVRKPNTVQPLGTTSVQNLGHDRAMAITASFVCLTCCMQDLKLLVNSGLLQKGAIVVADNILIPGAPDYKAFLQSREGLELFDTHFVSSRFEYSILPLQDEVSVSVFKGSMAA